MRSSSRPDASRSATRRASRIGRHHLSRDQPAQAGQQHQEQDAGRDQGVLEQAEGVALLTHREDQVERVVATVRGQHDLAADDHARHVVLGLARQVAELVKAQAVPGSPPRSAQRGRHAARLDARAGGGARTGVEAARVPATGPTRTTTKPRTFPRSTRFSRSWLSWVAGVGVAAACLLEPAGRERGLALGLGEGRLDPVVDETSGDLAQQQPADDTDHDRGEQQHGNDHARLHRASPDGQPPDQRRTTRADGAAAVPARLRRSVGARP